MNVELLLKAITKHDVEILYKVADVCSSCAQKVIAVAPLCSWFCILFCCPLNCGLLLCCSQLHVDR